MVDWLKFFPGQVADAEIVVVKADVNTLLARLTAERAALLDSIAVIERHQHSRGRWLGARPGWDGSNEVNSAINSSMAPFQIDAGNDTWGDPKCVLGSGDTPVIGGKTKFDFNRLSIRSTEVDAPYRIRIAWGESYAAAVAAGAFTEATFLAVDKKAASVPVEFSNPRVSAGSKVFMAC